VSSASLLHDEGWKLTASVIEVFAPLLREEEKAEAFREVYERVRRGLEKYEERASRRRRRLGRE
jgi:hypothetical protein